MGIVVQIVNFICGHALNHRLFQKFYDEIRMEHSILLYQTEVCWLSHGCVFMCVIELRIEVLEFLKHQQSPQPIILNMNILLLTWDIWLIFSVSSLI